MRGKANLASRLLCVLFLTIPAQAQYGGGDGTAANPYLIYTTGQMNAIGAESSDWNKHFKLMADIDLSSIGTAFNIIGTSGGRPFSGVFEGDGHSISNFECGAPDIYGIGLFGYVNGQDAQIKNLRLIDAVIHAETEDYVGLLIGRIHSGTITACSVENGFVYGDEKVGGLIGFNNGLITQCYSTATVSGTNDVGGLVGENFSKIINCYSSGIVSGNEKIGGLVGNGYNPDSITNCYSTTQISGSKLVGGLVGTINRAKWSFWDIETSGQTDSGGGTGLTTAEMKSASTFIGYWGCDPVWTIDEGADYPRLAWQNMPGELIIKPSYAEGSGTEADPYSIYTDEQLNMIGLFQCDWDKHFKLMADIDLSQYKGTDFNTIGYASGWWASSENKYPFTGVFDGNGRAISNFSYSSTEQESYIGIFGYTERAIIKNLYLIDPNINIESGEHVGSLVGFFLYGTITACYVQGGNILGASEVGGLVGNNHGTISECASLTKVQGGSRIGGLVGYNGYGTIGNCYSFSNVTGINTVGGLVGLCDSQASILNSYSVGSIQGTENVGGLLGLDDQGKILHCFWDIETSGQENSAGGEGKTTAEMQAASTFIGWGPYAVWTINEGHDYPRLLWENMPGESLMTPSFPSIQGSGTQDDPYLIYTAEQFNQVGLFPLEWDKHFKLMSDIDLAGYTSATFNTIGCYTRYPVSGNKPFKGVFDGNGCAISNFNYTGSGGGIFDRVEDAEIKDLGFINPNVSLNDRGDRVGLLAGWLLNSTITNCYVQGGSVSGTGIVGGLVGDNYGGTISNSHFQGSVFGSSGVGGLVCWNRGIITNCHFNGEVSGAGRQVGGLAGNNSGSINDCSASAHVSGIDEVGGLVGEQWSGRITNCYTAGSVSGEEQIGGLIGRNNGVITNCYTTSEVSGATYVGGFAGRNGFNPSDVVWHGNIYNCYARGDVVGEENVGGFAGNNDYFGLIYDCYSTGNVLGVEGIGGLVGQNRQGDVIDSFWDIETSGQTISAGGTGKTTAQMQTAYTFIRWSACGSEGVWNIDEGNDYPRLSWENQPGEPIAFAGFTGTGSKEDPYLIYTADELNSIGLFPCEWGKSFKLMADIDLSTFTGTEFNTIGYTDIDPWLYNSNKIPFTGIFDGNGHTISNLTYTSKDVNNLGLFGLMSDPNAEIKNLELVDSYISVPNGNHIGSLVGCLLGGSITNCHTTNCIVSGNSDVGGLVGRNGYLYTRGVNPDYTVRIMNCHSTGSVTGTANTGGLVGNNYLGAIVGCYSTSIVTGTTYVGGLVGDNYDSITNCYTTGNIIGEDTVGGLVGFNSRAITNCYSASNVTGNRLTGGLVGNQYNDSANIYKSFWDIEMSGQVASAGGEGKTTDEMQDYITFREAGWDFVGKSDGPSDIWYAEESGGYPILWWQLPALPSLPTFSGGTGEPNDPYLITSAEDLNHIGHNPRMMEFHFRLINDIDLSGMEFHPIGHQEYPYSGTFDGGGFKISNLAYTSIGKSCVGLFACLQGEEASVIDLNIFNVNIDIGSGSIVGTHVGLLRKGIISNCHIDGGDISGNDSIGGLVGYNDEGTIISCSAVCSISGDQKVGGLVGYNIGTISDSYALGTVFGNKMVGGFVGENDTSPYVISSSKKYITGSITNSYSTGSVSGTDYIGGLIGRNNKGTIAACFSNSNISGRWEVGGLIGYNVDAVITNCYSLGNISGKRNTGGLVGRCHYDGIIDHCYSACNIQGTNSFGGLLGLNTSSSEVLYSFWDIETSGLTNMCGTQRDGAAGCDDSYGKTTVEMYTASTFLSVGWDFVDETTNGMEDIWWILEGQDYPHLWWEPTENLLLDD
jgi:hypothetical protein